MESEIAADLERYFEENFQLTPTGRQICLFLSYYNCREDVMRLMGLKSGNMKFHLKHIYAKLLPENINTRDKLHRLAILLWRTRGKILKNYT